MNAETTDPAPDETDDVCGYENTTTGRPCQNPASHADGRCYRHTAVGETERVPFQAIRSVVSALPLPLRDDPETDGESVSAMEVAMLLVGFSFGIWWGHDEAVLNVIVGIIATAYGLNGAGKVTTRVPPWVRRGIQRNLHYFIAGVIVGAAVILHLHGWGRIPFDIPDILGVAG